MARHTHLSALCLAIALASAAHAQFSFGIGTGGGSAFYYGRGGGYYGPGYGRGYYGPGYYGPGYGSGVGIRVGNLGYYDDDDGYYGGRGYYSRPQVNNYYVLPNNSVAATPRILPDNKVTPTKLTLNSGDILIKSPQDAPGDVGYGINDTWVYTIKPGQKQKLEAGRQWTIEFNRGVDGAEAARYSLEPGIYEFHFQEDAGWELERVSDSVLPTPPQAAAADKAAEQGDDNDVTLPAEPPVEK